jgi:hypothetical protein
MIELLFPIEVVFESIELIVEVLLIYCVCAQFKPTPSPTPKPTPIEDVIPIRAPQIQKEHNGVFIVMKFGIILIPSCCNILIGSPTNKSKRNLIKLSISQNNSEKLGTSSSRFLLVRVG